MVLQHIYIKCSLKEYGKEYYRFKNLFDKDSLLGYVPNSLGGENHPQFTITILENKITVFTTEHGINNMRDK